MEPLPDQLDVICRSRVPSLRLPWDLSSALAPRGRSNGARVIEQASIDLYDLALPERNGFPETVVQIAHFLARMSPS